MNEEPYKYKEDWPLVKKMCIPSGDLQRMMVVLMSMTANLAGKPEVQITIKERTAKNNPEIRRMIMEYRYPDTPPGKCHESSTDFEGYHKAMAQSFFLAQEIFGAFISSFQAVIDYDSETGNVNIECRYSGEGGNK